MQFDCRLGRDASVLLDVEADGKFVGRVIQTPTGYVGVADGEPGYICDAPTASEVCQMVKDYVSGEKEAPDGDHAS